MPPRKKKSSKQSDTNIKKRLEKVVFFLDRSLGEKTVPNRLQKFGLNVENHSAHFSPDAEDVEWLEKCGANGWIVLAKDKNIKKNFLERQALFSAGIAAFFSDRRRI